jgi:hypothetical protein
MPKQPIRKPLVPGDEVVSYHQIVGFEIDHAWTCADNHDRQAICAVVRLAPWCEVHEFKPAKDDVYYLRRQGLSMPNATPLLVESIEYGYPCEDDSPGTKMTLVQRKAIDQGVYRRIW